VKNELVLNIPGKWILLGEHSVVRGGPALAFPLINQKLFIRAQWEKYAGDFSLYAREEKCLPLTDALGKALAASSFSPILPSIKVQIDITSTIPVSSGQGSSAAICTAAASLLKEWGLLPQEKIFSVAHEMENHFHGSSSGLDIAAVQSQQGIYFKKDITPAPLKLAWTPKLYLFDSGGRSSTKDAVNQVTALKRNDLDSLMTNAVELAKKSLEEKDSIEVLAEAIHMGEKCFKEWGLISKEMQDAQTLLKKSGAIAVKPTGSGNGGFLVSLWDKQPAKELPLIPCFNNN